MRGVSRAEEEVDEWKAKVYEEIKDLTPQQYEERAKRISDEIAKKYGFKVVKGTKDDE